MSEQFEKWHGEHFFAKGGTDAEPLLSMQDLRDAYRAGQNAALASSAAAEMPDRPLFSGKHDGSIASDHFDKLESIIAGLRVQVEAKDTLLEGCIFLYECDSCAWIANPHNLGQACSACHKGKCVKLVISAVTEHHNVYFSNLYRCLLERAEKAELALSTAEQVGIRKALEAVRGVPSPLSTRHAESAIPAILPKEGATP